MQRREFLWTSVALGAGAMWPHGRSRAAFNPTPESGWRIFEVTHRVEVLRPEGTTRVWLPLPSVQCRKRTGSATWAACGRAIP